MKYRPDIDGLRSIAVIAILLFHVDVRFFNGGYVGVDIFFVISGYLITRVIRDEVLETGSFSFPNFYMRRARRLFPALFFTLTLSCVFACLLFSPQYLKRFGGSLLHAIASVSNFYFWGESGYFDEAARFKPLLHTWSLGVEEQFYIVWPGFIVFLLLKARKLTAPITIILAGIFSLYLNHVFLGGEIDIVSKIAPSVAKLFNDGSATIYFLMPFRIFEFSIGAIMVWLVKYQPGNKHALEPFVVIGLAMIAYAVFTYTNRTVFPSFNALLPCIGTALIIYGGTARYSGKLLNNPLAVGLGLISYSLYLIHWPIIVFYKYYYIAQLTFRGRFVICVVSIVAAVLMYHFVEQPFRRRAKDPRALSPGGFGFACGMLAIIIMIPAANIWANNGWLKKSDRTTAFISNDDTEGAQEKRFKYLDSKDGCYIGDMSKCNNNADLQILTFGDSHELDAYNTLTSQYGNRKNINIISFGSSYGCEFDLKEDRVINKQQNENMKCSYRADMLNDEKFLNSLDIIAFSSLKPLSWGARRLAILEHIKEKHKNIKVIFFSGYFSVRPSRCDDIINRFGSSEFCKDERFVEYFAAHDKEQIINMPLARSNFLYVDKVELFCEGRLLKNCLTQINGVPAFYDGDHLSVEFAKLLGEKMSVYYADELLKMGL